MSSVPPRCWRVAVAVGIALAAHLGLAGLPAHATERGPMTVESGKVATETFPALVGAAPTSEEDIRPLPGDCKTYVWCDTVVLDTVTPEGLSEDDDWTLLVEVSWDDPSGSNDIDIFLYDDGQKKGGAGYTLVGSGGSADNPEKAKTLHPDGRYNLVVLNFAGGNTGYTVKATINVSPYSSPYEVLAPPKTTSTTAKPAAEDAPKESVGPNPTVTPTTLAPVTASSDDDFDFGSSDFEDQLAAPTDFGGEPPDAAPATQAEDVSGLSVALWLIGSPVLLGAGAGAWFFRRRQTFAFE